MPIVPVSADVIVGSPFEQGSFRVNDWEVDMNHLETLESVEHVICERCGNAYAPDADECSRCGAVSHTAPRNKGSVNDSEAWTGRHPRRLRRAHESSPYPSIQEEVVPRSMSMRRNRRPGLRSAAAITVIGLSMAALAYTRTDGKFERTSVPQHVSASGAVMALSSSDTSGEPDTKRVSSAPSSASSTAADKSTADVMPTTDVTATRVAGIVAGARNALRKGDLTDARERLGKLPASLRTNPETRLLFADLIRRERERDAALQRARWCEEGKDWSCVARNAAHVQALDTSNAESRVMLSNAVIKIGWAGSTASTAPNRPAQASARPRADNQ
jgi:ribosomal protein L37E